MRRLLCLTMLVPVVVTAAQQDPGYSVLSRAAAALQRVEPEWQFVTGIMNVPKLFVLILPTVALASCSCR